MIWTALKSLLGGLWGYVAAAGAAVLGVLAIYRSGRQAGSEAVQAKTLQKEAEDAKQANQIERDVATSKPGAAADELRNKWSRD